MAITTRSMKRRRVAETKVAPALDNVVEKKEGTEAEAEEAVVINADGRDLQGKLMTPFQEYCNAYSMVFPAMLCFWYDRAEGTLELRENHDLLVLTMMVSTVVHLPFSFFYHIWCARNPDKERVRGNVLRILDQVFIHVACVGYAFALSGSLFYTAFALAHNARGIYRLWQPSSPSGERKLNIFLGAAIYLVPILAWHGTQRYLLCKALFLTMVAPFCIRFLGGYSQTVFHLLAVPYQWALLNSVAPALAGDDAILNLVQTSFS